MILCIGQTGSGKTSLLKRLNQYSIKGNFNLDSNLTTIPTVGTNIINVTNTDFNVKITEIGGQMSPVWSEYFDETKLIIYVIDISDPTQIAFNCIQLLKLIQLQSSESKLKYICIVLNKIDLHCNVHKQDLINSLFIDSMQKKSSVKIFLMQVSCLNCKGLSELFDLITRLIKN